MEDKVRGFLPSILSPELTVFLRASGVHAVILTVVDLRYARTGADVLGGEHLGMWGEDSSGPTTSSFWGVKFGEFCSQAAVPQHRLVKKTLEVTVGSPSCFIQTLSIQHEKNRDAVADHMLRGSSS